MNPRKGKQFSKLDVRDGLFPAKCHLTCPLLPIQDEHVSFLYQGRVFRFESVRCKGNTRSMFKVHLTTCRQLYSRIVAVKGKEIEININSCP